MRRSVRHGSEVAGEVLGEAASFAEIFAALRTEIARDDPSAFVLVNLETPVAAHRVDNDAFRHLKTGERRVPAPLNAPAWIVHGLAAAGVDAVTLANNHTLDQGREGLGETIRAARDAGLIVTGAGFVPNVRWPITVGDDGAELAVLSYLERDFPEPRGLVQGDPSVSIYGPEALGEVRSAKASHRAVVVLVHVVAELETRVVPSWRAMAHALADAGADVVAIHGQHVPAPVETIEAEDGRDVVVAYGLGNLLSDMGSRARPGREVPEEENKLELPDASEGLLLRVSIEADALDVRFLPVFVASSRYFVYNRALDGPPTFHILPLSPCGPVALADTWPADGALADDMRVWLTERRDHLLAATHLTPRCEGTPGPSASSLLAPPRDSVAP